MKYAKLLYNDTVNTEDGIAVTLFMQGCPHHCNGCFNPETWDFCGGLDISERNLDEKILTAISENGIQRNFSILGGEPLAPQNISYTRHIMELVKKTYPGIKVYIWTGYTLPYLQTLDDIDLDCILLNVDCLIDGPFIQSEKDLTLKLRGSRNQGLHYKIDKN